MMAGKNKGIMPEQLKYELAKELSVYDILLKEGWVSVPLRNSGNRVTEAIYKAQSKVANLVE